MKRSHRGKVVSTPVIPEDSMDHEVEGMKKMRQTMSQMTFMGMHDIAMLQVLGQLDIPSLLAMRLVNKRMNTLYSEIKYLKEIKITIAPTGYNLEVNPLNDPLITTAYENIDELVKKLHEMALKTPVHLIRVDMHDSLNEEQLRIFNELSNFEADKLVVQRAPRGPCLLSPSRPPLPLPTLLAYAKNIRRVHFELAYLTITAENLILLRKELLEKECKMENFHYQPLGDDFPALSECFGITMDRTIDWRKKRELWKFKANVVGRSKTKLIEIYLKMADWSSVIPTMHKFEDDIHTLIDHEFFEIKKERIDVKADESYEKLKFNRRYVYPW